MGGLLRVPYSRESLKAAASTFEIDVQTFNYVQGPSMQWTGGNRDTGFQIRGYFLDDRLEYRVTATQGFRQTNSKNSFALTGRVQYNFFDNELYNMPSYPGSYFDGKKILAVGAAYQKQGTFKYASGDVFASITHVVGNRRRDGPIPVPGRRHVLPPPRAPEHLHGRGWLLREGNEDRAVGPLRAGQLQRRNEPERPAYLGAASAGSPSATTSTSRRPISGSCRRTPSTGTSSSSSCSSTTSDPPPSAPVARAFRPRSRRPRSDSGSYSRRVNDGPAGA